MYPYYSYGPYAHQYLNYPVQALPYWGAQAPIYGYSVEYNDDWYSEDDYDDWYRQKPIRGQATWTEGGAVTKCGIPWSRNRFMTAAVGVNTPYRCGQSLKIRNLSIPGGREIIVTVVDRVAGYPANRINLHRRAFEALGANPSLGVINIEIIPSPELEQEKWGKYLLEVTQTAYPGYNIIDYRSVGKQQLSPQQTKETFEFTLQSPRERLKVRGNVIYNPTTDRVVSFDLVEV
ncbi:DUF3889 domain-containing protein [Bacillus marasmi]|uniref:DUF3889 domain-containing protein n=1 Tax=Bacillus marasmi TaxID=1926279 RepID=UPI0011CC4114|nr:DUF3889 domain-containing protein [Bacillus marasmi]